MNEPTLRKLNLLFPLALETRVVEFLLAHTPSLPGFVVLNGEGHGQDFTQASVREQVLGRVETRWLVMLLAKDRCDQLIEDLADAFRGTGLAVWTEAVSGFRELT